jgi:type I restriction enzyme S subunit
MTPQQLRNSILQQAIEGKLVEQRPEEGTAEDLYAQIHEEKKKLIAEGKIKKEKPFHEINEDEIPFDIPESWKWVRLGTVITLLSGRDLALTDILTSPTEFPYLTGASQIQAETIVINRWTNNPLVLSEVNDILISCKGTVGKIVINSIGKIHIARQIMALRTSSNVLCKEYVKYYLKTIVSNLIAKSNGVIPGISRDDLLYRLFPLPPLAEQKRIVAKIEELLPCCDKLN